MHRLTLTIVTAVLVLVGTSAALLLFDPRVNGADALRTGGLAAGSVVALYALWLNDRRRRVEERRQELDMRRQALDSERYSLEQQRQALEDRRTGHEYERAADERFARAVELLGHEADQVRVGAIHGLAGLARSNPDYTQTVLDVLCSYLRRPFDHPKWTTSNNVPASQEATPEQERERTVRQAACKSLRALLPSTKLTDPTVYDLDLSYAHLELIDLSDRVIGRLAAYSTKFRHSVRWERAEFRGPVQLARAVFLDKVLANDAVFHGNFEARDLRLCRPADFERAEFNGEIDLRSLRCEEFVSFHHAVMRGSVDLRYAHFERGLHLRIGGPEPTFSLHKTTVTTKVHARLPPGLTVEPTTSPGLGWIRAGDPGTQSVTARPASSAPPEYDRT